VDEGTGFGSCLPLGFRIMKYAGRYNGQGKAGERRVAVVGGRDARTGRRLMCAGKRVLAGGP